MYAIRSYYVLVDLFAVEDAGLDVVVPLLVQDILQHLLGIRIEDGAHGFHPEIQVAGHQVARADQVAGVAPVVEPVDPGVFQEAIDNTDRLSYNFV